MKSIEIKSNEYKILSLDSDTKMFTMNLGKEIACTFFSKSLKKTALGRNLAKNQIVTLISQMSNKEESPYLIDVSIAGGLNCEESKLYLVELINNLFTIDNNQNFINIKAFDVCERIHPHSLELNCSSGSIKAI
jgi:hypothetical protein